MTTYEALTVTLQSNLVLIGIITIMVMLLVSNKKK